MPFIELGSLPQREPVPGYRGRFVHTDTMTLAYWEVTADSPIPEHAHPNEQVLNLLEGTFHLTVGGDTKTLQPGDVVVIPPDVPHSGISITECRIIDAFHPVREDLRAGEESAAGSS